MGGRRVTLVDFPAQYAAEKDDILRTVDEVLSGGMWVGGPAVDGFENAVAEYCGTKHAIAVNSGTDALILGLEAIGIGPGDEVITPPNSFISSTSCIVRVGATPVFVDVRPDQNIDPTLIEAAITPKTKAIMPVHLTGRIADMGPIMAIAQRHGLKVIEDAAQAIGSRYDGKCGGAIGHVGCFSAHPLKNLNAMGDAGFVTTDDENVANHIRLARNIGMKDRNTVVQWGIVSRMDPVQAAILLHRLRTLDETIAAKRRIVEAYRATLDSEHVVWAPCRNVEFNSFQNFVVQVDRRDALQAHLAANGIDSSVHYPIPIHLQPVAAALGHKAGDFPETERQSGRILTLPSHRFLTDADIEYVCEAVNGFFRGH